MFVDLGAHNGVMFSNTLYLEQKLGWTGLAMEPIPEIFSQLKRNRHCTVLNACVGPRTGKARFQVISGYSETLSGLIDEYDRRHAERVERELRVYGGERYEIEVHCYRLNELLDKHGIKRIDYLSIDIEGAEFSVLNSFDFADCSIAVIGVENNYKDYRIPRLLIERGFQLHSIVGDEFYVKRKALTT